jgi:hypothetical protein
LIPFSSSSYSDIYLYLSIYLSIYILVSVTSYGPTIYHSFVLLAHFYTLALNARKSILYIGLKDDGLDWIGLDWIGCDYYYDCGENSPLEP